MKSLKPNLLNTIEIVRPKIKNIPVFIKIFMSIATFRSFLLINKLISKIIKYDKNVAYAAPKSSILGIKKIFKSKLIKLPKNNIYMDNEVFSNNWNI